MGATDITLHKSACLAVSYIACETVKKTGQTISEGSSNATLRYHPWPGRGNAAGSSVYNRRPYLHTDLHHSSGSANFDGHLYTYAARTDVNSYAYRRATRSYCHTHGRIHDRR